MSNTNDGPYRVISVGNTGGSTKSKFKKWSQAYSVFNQIKRMNHIRYAVIIELTEDVNHAGIKEEYYAGPLKG